MLYLFRPANRSLIDVPKNQLRDEIKMGLSHLQKATFGGGVLVSEPKG